MNRPKDVELCRSAHRQHFWNDSTRTRRGGAKTAEPQDQIQPANAYAAMRRPLLPLLLAAAAGWQPHQSCRRPTTRLDLQPPTEAPPPTAVAIAIQPLWRRKLALLSLLMAGREGSG